MTDAEGTDMEAQLPTEDVRQEDELPKTEPIATRDIAGIGGDVQRAPLLGADELQTVVARWNEIQARFVDEPRQAVQDADALVADLMQRLAKSFARERGELETRWSGGEEVSTEQLRQGLRHYRSFFERLREA